MQTDSFHMANSGAVFFHAIFEGKNEKSEGQDGEISD